MTIDIDKEKFLEFGFLRIDNVIPIEELNWIRETYDEMFNEGSDKPVRKELGGKDEFDTLLKKPLYYFFNGITYRQSS